MAAKIDADVVVIGMGPVGASVAGLLGLRGVKVVGLEKEMDVYPLPRAAHIDHTSLRTLQELGCVDELTEKMMVNPGLDLRTASDQVLAPLPGHGTSLSGFPSSMYFHQPAFDRRLQEAARAAGAEVRLGTRVTHVEQVGDVVEVSVTGADCRESTVTASYVVGCDGGTSPLRESLGITMEDLEFHEQWLVVDIRLKRPVTTLPTLAVEYCDPSRPVGIVPIPGDRYRFELMLLPGERREEMEDPAVVAELLARWIPMDATEVERTAVYTFHGLVADEWRRGRIFLAGDAAHLMPPFLGQGMNSGLRDATNVSWKLAAVLRGRGGDVLLDTYEAERRPHVKSVIESSVRIGQTVCMLNPVDAASRDKRILSGTYPLDELAFRLPKLEPGDLVLQSGGGLFPQPVVESSTARFDDFVGARFMVIGRTADDLGESAAWWLEEMAALVTMPSEHPLFSDQLIGALNAFDADVIVVRPDRYVLGAGKSLNAITKEVRAILAPALETAT